MNLEYIKIRNSDEKLLENYQVRQTVHTLSTDPIKKTLEKQDYDKKINIAKISEVFVALLENDMLVSTNEVRMAFENFVEKMETLALLDKKKGKISSTNIKNLDEIQNLFDRDIKFQNGCIYFLLDKNNSYILNQLLMHLAQKFQVKVGVFSFNGRYAGAGTPIKSDKKFLE